MNATAGRRGVLHPSDCFRLGDRHVRKNGGAERDRTVDLLTASQALSQLSYSPTQGVADLVFYLRSAPGSTFAPLSRRVT